MPTEANGDAVPASPSDNCSAKAHGRITLCHGHRRRASRMGCPGPTSCTLLSDTPPDLPLRTSMTPRHCAAHTEALITRCSCMELQSPIPVASPPSTCQAGRRCCENLREHCQRCNSQRWSCCEYQEITQRRSNQKTAHRFR